jgi:hypothetical protein
MLQAPQVKPISKLRTDHMAVMRLLKEGPVFLAQRGTLAAAMLSIEEWNKIASELARLRRIIEADQQFAALAKGNRVEFDITQAPV